MPLVPATIEKLVFLVMNQGPGILLDLFGGVAYWCVMAAIRLGVFETLGTRSLTVKELAAQLDTDVRGMGILLDALESLGYVTSRDGAYANTAMTRKWLTSQGEVDFSAFYRYWGVLLEQFMPALETSIRTGEPPTHLYEWIEDQPEVSRDFQQGMIKLARYSVVDVVKAISLPKHARRVLDVGGGHATYSIELCAQHPGLSAVVFDSPQALATGRASIAEAGMAARITAQEGNFFTDDLGDDYDVVLLFNIVHGLLPEGNIELFGKVARALNPGGQIVILEQLAGASMMRLRETIARLLGVSYFHLIGGQIYTYEDISSWLVKAGFMAVRHKMVYRASSALVTATLPG